MINFKKPSTIEQPLFDYDTHPALGLFYQRLPKYPYTMDKLGPVYQLPKSEAIRMRYIQPHPKGVVGVLAFDIDRAFGALAWEEANLPPPNLAVVNPKNSHAHLLYLIEEPIYLNESNRFSDAARFLGSTRLGMTLQLGADPGYSGFTCKNPLHPYWKVWSPESNPYELNELFEYLNPEVLYHIGTYARHADEIHIGRNVGLFHQVRKACYPKVSCYRQTGNFDLWLGFVHQTATQANAGFENPLPPPEVKHLAKSIAEWTWGNYGKGYSQEQFSRTQSIRGQRSGKARRQSTENRLLAIVEEMEESHQPPSVGAIADRMGVDRTTVWRRAKGLGLDGVASRNGKYRTLASGTVRLRSLNFNTGVR